jgi:hypothetical protein
VIRQYGAQRRRGGDNPLGVGVVAAGTIVYLQDDGWWRDRYRGRPVCRNPWMVTTFLNGTVAAGRRNRNTGLWEDVYLSGRSDMAIVRSLRDGRERQVAVRTLILHDDEGLVRQPSLYPTLPAIRIGTFRQFSERGPELRPPIKMMSDLVRPLSTRSRCRVRRPAGPVRPRGHAR